MPAEIHVNDTGTAFRITILNESLEVVNLSGAITKDILFLKPNNDVMTKEATLVNEGISGVLQYVTASGDLSVAGLWKIQAHINVDNSDLYSDISSFQVHDNLG